MPYQISSEAQDDLFEIWQWIAEDSIDLANRVESEFYSLFESLPGMPGKGHRRSDLTSRSVLFVSLHSFVVVYDPNAKPLRILAVVRGKRDVPRILQKRP